MHKKKYDMSSDLNLKSRHSKFFRCFTTWN